MVWSKDEFRENKDSMDWEKEINLRYYVCKVGIGVGFQQIYAFGYSVDLQEIETLNYGHKT